MAEEYYHSHFLQDISSFCNVALSLLELCKLACESCTLYLYVNLHRTQVLMQSSRPLRSG